MKRKVLTTLVITCFAAAISLELSVLFAEASSKRPKMTPEHQEFYNYARYLFTKYERKIFHNLTTDEARERFIQNFWEIRDPTPFTPDNEFKLEMEQRYDYVSKYLKEGPIPGWETDRGRIYLMLGPPSAQQENQVNLGTMIRWYIWWYYDEYDVYIQFYDDIGHGIFRMDLANVSLGLLDVLDNKKYFIVDKEGKIKWETLDIDINYDSKTRGFLVEISTKNLNYEKVSESSAEMLAKIKVDLVVYRSDKADDFYRYSEVKSVKVRKEKLLEKNAFISLAVPLELPTGKIKIDAIISDALGDAVYRKFISLNIKKGG